MGRGGVIDRECVCMIAAGVVVSCGRARFDAGCLRGTSEAVRLCLIPAVLRSFSTVCCWRHAVHMMRHLRASVSAFLNRKAIRHAGTDAVF